MRLKFVKVYKSVRSLTESELPNFVVLTGINGAGKSHMLEAMESGAIEVDGIIQNLQAQSDPNGRLVRRFDSTNIVPSDSGAFSPSQITQERGNFWTEISQHQQTHNPLVFAAVRDLPSEYSQMSIRELLAVTPQDLEKAGVELAIANQTVSSIQSLAQNTSQNIEARFLQGDPSKRGAILSHYRDKGLTFAAMEADDFYAAFPKTWIPVDLFQQSFGRLFADYQRDWSENQLREFASSKGEKISFLGKSEFVEKNGEPPWDFVNKVFETAGLNFRINEPHKYEDRPYEPILTDKNTKTQVRFGDLSSGEKVLMSFALCLYYAQDGRQRVNYPKVLLFDEIDAPLHPSMTQSLLRTIEAILVQKYQIKVILTTHSPSTVALAPEESIYVMHKDGPNRIRKTTKDVALSLLTTGVPTLSVNYENRRQIFVESDYDVKYYDRLYGQLKSFLIPEISLNFVSSGVRGNGNCDQVKDIVRRLSSAGNKTVFGLVDWDLTNSHMDRIHITGNGTRHSIENYLLDPILVAGLLLREKFVSKEEMGLPSLANYTELVQVGQESIQIAVDFVVCAVRQVINTGNEQSILDVNYLCGQSAKIPQWYLQLQGHELERSLKQAFPKLLRYRNESDLKLAIIEKLTDDCPLLISSDIVSTFRTLQTA